ncbi:Uncharacterised protein [Legionella pneumophila]|nr:Uncharacterised protein [Legionella pneumophila]STX65892.1 Uncharacterised protein [Legionella pneumophila]STX81753.1 Uncharacterised protein [Legionella pneumophila]
MGVLSLRDKLMLYYKVIIKEALHCEREVCHMV